MTDAEILKEFATDRQECEIYIRCMGYYASLYNFNKGKKSEFKERVYFNEPTSKELKQRERIAV